MLKRLMSLSILCFVFLAGCAHQTVQNDFMRNRPEQIKIGKLPYSNEIGILYEV
ncbi:MAG: hypothetical protein JSR17_00460 [Proteobacteria bacterium]|nr:hypothetical protein [Pseudomonadota bacterium]